MIRLIELRKAKKLSQLNLGVKIGVAQETISGYEIGRSEPDLASLIKLADVLDVSVDYLLERTDIKTMITETDLTAQEIELLSIFRSLPSPKKERAIGMVTGLSE
ncbi:helix-turn-helix transcriptional regulator [Chakrabartyella piscis]|uniref:helix-turn-helix domain-containing protein n=1 Tax=Chakrabartyella piscis TaxID=2918914 RepID=UPI0029587BF6|nr:helix-turn-helix transcriptional regulator [Chakrabartyella piscis]